MFGIISCTDELEELFLKNIRKKSGKGCWQWLGRLDEHGYGIFYCSLVRRQYRAHRVSYSWYCGNIPEGLVIDHLCRNRACVNPKHLEPVTTRENILRGIGFAARFRQRNHCKYGHPLFGANLRMRGTARVCRTCAKRCTYESRDRKRLTKATSHATLRVPSKGEMQVMDF